MYTNIHNLFICVSMLLNNCYFLYLFKIEEDNLKNDNDFFI